VHVAEGEEEKMKILASVIFGVALVVVTICFIACGHVTGNGTRVGTIIKLSDEGWWHKTHEIEIVRGGMNAASGGFGVKPFFATISDEYTYQQAMQYFNTQTEVEINYTDLFGSFWSSECNGEDENCAFVLTIVPRADVEERHGSAQTTGNNSAAITGDGNSVNISH
jgi:hypothetical protein